MKLIYGIATLLALGVFDVALATSAKIDTGLTETLQRNARAKILVSMKDGIQDVLDELSTRSFDSDTERRQALYDALNSRAQQSQGKLLRLLSTPSVSQKFQFVNVKSFWITNQITVELASSEFINHLASMDEVSKIQENVAVQLQHPTVHEVADEPPVGITANQWGVDRVEAPAAWPLYNTSNVIIVAGIDTGVRASHEILRGAYLNDGYSHYDAVYGGQVPFDANGHGTHTMGTIVGANGYGVAPNAKFVACQGLDDAGSGYADTLFACGQWIICRSRPDGSNPDCSRSCNVVNNSWGQNAGGNTYFSSMIAVWHSARIIPVFSNGNTGTRCGTATSPADDNVLGIGATTPDDGLASFSSVGPPPRGGIKPDVSAPGDGIESASHLTDTRYVVMSGTSMAAPHVAGAVALILNQNRNLSYFQVGTILTQNADRNLKSSGATCGGIPDTTFPNNHFGYGRLNALRSVQAARV